MKKIVQRWGAPVLASLLWAGLLTRRSSNLDILGRYSVTFFLALAAWGLLVAVLWRIACNPGRFDRLSAAMRHHRLLPACSVVVLGAAAAGFVLRRNAWTPPLLVLLALALAVASAADARRAARHLLKGLAASVFSTVLCIALLEGLLAVVHPVPPAVETLMYYEPDPYTGYRHKPGSKGFYQHGITAEANRCGHRDDEVAVKKLPGTYRILLLGDSYAMGYDVRQEEAFPQVLESALRARLGDRIEVVNAAVSGWQPFQYAQYCEHYGAPFEPDLVIVTLFVGNDAYNQDRSVEDCWTAIRGVRVTREAARRRAASWFRILLYERSHLVRLVMNRRVLARSSEQADFTRKHCDDFSEPYLRITRDWLPNHLRETEEQRRLASNAVFQVGRIGRWGADRQAPVAAFLIPFELQISPALRRRVVDEDSAAHYDFDMPQKMLTRLLAERGIRVVDPLPEFRAATNCFYMNDAHWNADAHRLAADVLLTNLLAVLPLPRR
jgi:hypothetical protein